MTQTEAAARDSLVAVKRIVLAGLVLVAGIFVFYRPARIWALVTAGRAQGCTLQHALGIDERFVRQTQIKDRILAASKLVQKDDEGYSLYETPYGPYWIPSGDQYVLPFNLAEQEMQIYGTGDRAVRAGDIVLDCGANVGVYTRVALKAGAKLVVSIEPAPENLECLRRNFAKDVADGRVIIYPKGVWDKEDVLELRRDPNNTAADSFVLLRDKTASSVQAPLTTIDILVDELKLPRVDFIKMDIEGAEVKAIHGARSTIDKFHPRMALTTYHQPDHAVEVPKAVLEAWPLYHVESGPCAFVDRFTIRPDVVYFY